MIFPRRALLAAICLIGVGCTTSDIDSDAAVADGDIETEASIIDGDIETTTAEVDCSQEALSGDDDQYVFTSAYVIEDGQLGELCFGDDDDTILDAWFALETITPPGQLGDLTLFGGFEPDGDDAAETMAYVNILDVDGNSFQMSINTVEALADPDELLLTLAHELTHVFAATPTELDRSDEAIDNCETYFNGDGCYFDDSLMLAWIDAFWAPEVLAGVDVEVDSPDDAELRCGDDDGFFGAYAATSPEEDFAEAFSAFVFRLEPVTDGQADRLVWIEEQPGLAEFRDRADAAGLTPLANNFDVCGL
jgi:hypothetical protein